MNKIAVFGGAFDPPHNAHIAIADKAVELYGYEKVVILPSVNPPHKRTVGDAEHRLNMAKLAFNDRRYEVCDIELKSDGYGYTVDTLPKLKEYLHQDFDFIIGGDSMRDFRKWYKYADILKLVNIVVAVRDGDYGAVSCAISYLDDLPKVGITVMEYRPQSISSSSVRLQRELGQDIRPSVQPIVAEYIYTNGLYSTYDAMRAKLQATITPERYKHTVGVVEFAMKYQSRLGLSYDEVFTACLLHDCAKYDVEYDLFDIPQDSLGTPVAHAFAGACIAKEEYGVCNSYVIDAIYYHCTAKANMSTLAMLVYVADMLEAGRSFDGAEELRACFDRDCLQGFRACLKSTYEHLKGGCERMYPLTEQAHEYYK